MSRPLPSATIQDMPPPGGYPVFKPKRYLPNRVSGGLLLGLCAITTAYGWYRYSLSVKEKRAMNQERFETRLAITPFLQAEEDVKFCEAEAKLEDREKRIMSEVPNWKVGENVYHTRWMAPTELR